MDALSRRRFLHVSAGAAATGATIGVTGLATASPAAGVDAAAGLEAATDGAQSAGPVVLYLKNAASDEVSIMQGSSEVIIHDRALARRVLRAASRSEV